ncbi:ribbon-helix-helix protein, CopG family [Alteriqipengyuania flavescens]|uniref:ribbon-helix-helix protein, CopG family n=1 Tax=Alteriqipengyuania flavescens TaxID=3053610 RepID=UPI0025B6157B|nr:ribbon-helix-helix protein, CopG family [Alteriqipengyuania flavescens]WJY18937.1 ribbon-helix-helix protein, CopG family [Alteriqipengyuania flavescens]WJY24877.1 ribbon-helix-helix protein, CopG family [Alteriqipengyuania flavescens]
MLADIPEEDLVRLDELARAESKSRAALIREAVADYLASESRQGFEKYFGLWSRHGSSVDGLEYERKLRGEWPDVADLDQAQAKPPKP